MRKPVHYRRARHRLRNLGIVFVVALIPWAWGLVRFDERVPETVADATTPTDAIVVLTGGQGRLEKGLDLLSEGLARRMFVSGVYHGVDVRQIITLSTHDPDALACCVEIGHGARDTLGNAAETAGWVRRHGMSSLRVVTAGYHMPRTMLEFRHAMPDVRLVPHPVFSPRVRTRDWWRWPGSSRLIVGEYTKYLLAQLRLSLSEVLETTADATP